VREEKIEERAQSRGRTNGRQTQKWDRSSKKKKGAKRDIGARTFCQRGAPEPRPSRKKNDGGGSPKRKTKYVDSEGEELQNLHL